MDTPIAICIVSYQRAALTKRCIESVRTETTLPYRIFLVDNGSYDIETRTLLTHLEDSPDIELLRLIKNHGPSFARNVVLAKIIPHFRYIAMLDNDIVTLPGWDVEAIHALKAGADLIQPKLLKADGRTLERGPTRPNTSQLAANPSYIGCGFSSDNPEVNGEEEATIVGGTGVVKSQVFKKIGLFDERLHIGEDFDFSFRAKSEGFSLRYVPKCELIHDHIFDFSYDQERGGTEKWLHAHVVLWHKWQKALMSPAYLGWYSWLYTHKEPMYLPVEQRWSIIHRRLIRRFVRTWFMTRYANEWSSLEDAEKATEALARRVGWTPTESSTSPLA